MNGKAFTILKTSCLSELSRIMAAKTLKNPYCWQAVRFKLSQKGKKTNILKEKPKVTCSVALGLAFLSAENENRQLEDLSLVDFGRLSERLLSVRTKSINKNFFNWKLRPFCFCNLDSTHFSILRVSASGLYDCYSGIVDSFIFIHQWSRLKCKIWLF